MAELGVTGLRSKSFVGIALVAAAIGASAQVRGAEEAIRESVKPLPAPTRKRAAGARYIESVGAYYNEASKLAPAESARRWLALAASQPAASAIWAWGSMRGRQDPSMVMRVLPSPAVWPEVERQALAAAGGKDKRAADAALQFDPCCHHRRQGPWGGRGAKQGYEVIIDDGFQEMYPDPARMAACWLDVKTLAPPRFARFEQPTDADELDSLCTYVWNIALCESLVAPLHLLEVALRNSLHNALTISRGSPRWYEDPHFLTIGDQQTVLNARKAVLKKRRPNDPPRVVAELMFGFWSRLLSSDYELTIFRPVVKDVFPGLPRRQRIRSTIARPVEDIRKLRNRLSHYECVCFDPQLPALHQEAVQLLGWINPTLQRTLAQVDTFSRIYAAGPAANRPALEMEFG